MIYLLITQPLIKERSPPCKRCAIALSPTFYFYACAIANQGISTVNIHIFGGINTMPGIKKLSMSIVGAAVLTLETVATAQAASFTFGINSKATFLRTHQDPQAADSIAIDLKSLGISSGDLIRLERLGDESLGAGYTEQPYASWDWATYMMTAVFSNSNILLASYLQNRVSGAVNAGEDILTDPTPKGLLATDIPEDFWLNDLTIKVPTSASYLFVGTTDPYPGDNTDPDGDYGLRISTISKAAPEPQSVPEPSTVLGGLAFSAFIAKMRMKRQRQQTSPESTGS